MFRCFFNIIDSTNKEAKDIINNNKSLPQEFSILSCIQTNGKGKLGSIWKSSEGNLHLSIVIKLSKYLNNLKDIGLLSIVTSVVVRETIEFFINKKENLSNKVLSKWPNDILIDGSKVAGILLELEHHKDNNQEETYLIIGTGINIVSSPKIDDYKTISLLDILGEKINYIKVANQLEDRFFSLIKDLQKNKLDIVNRFKSSLFNYKLPIKIRVGDRIESGIFSDITEEGYLILDINGNKKIITAGEIFGF